MNINTHTIKCYFFSKKQIGKEYDNVFLIDNNSYYCSELIYEAFLKDSIFKIQPMTFLHPNNNDTLKIWKDYYTKLRHEYSSKSTRNKSRHHVNYQKK